MRFSRSFVCRMICAFAMSAALLASFVMARHALADELSETAGEMSSAPETVFVNGISDTDVREQNFNDNWKFKLADLSGAEAATYDDSTWEDIDLPHDYSIDQAYTTSGEAESAYKLGGVGWYRKSFELSDALKDKHIRIDFDGVYMDASIYINGHKLGVHPYGYSPFSFDLTPYLKFGERNTIAVRVNHQTPSSRWYSGSGIGRDVNLVITNDVSVAKDGVVITTPKLKDEAGKQVTTHVETTIANKGDTDVEVSVIQSIFKRGAEAKDAIANKTSKKTIKKASESKLSVDLSAANPELWSIENPNLYVCRTELLVDGKVVDTLDTEFGYRYFNFDANKGFSLNGKNIKLKGVCMHHDQGALGSVDTEAALRRQVRILKEMGCNSIRTSHNTPPRALVEICQEEGILLNEEIFDGWTAPKNDNVNDYARFFNQKIGESELIGATADKTWAQFDLEQSIARDINSPSVIMWSVGNEMITGAKPGSFDSTAHKNLIAWTKAADPTRPVTLGDNQAKNGWSNTYNPSYLAEQGGLIGINYANQPNAYKQLHEKHPTWKIYGSETASAVNSRGVYNTMSGNQYAAGGQQLTSYDTSAVSWGHVASAAWYDTITRDYVAGEYVWTGFDYLGEPTHWNGTVPGAQGTWPSPKNSYFGIIDTAGLPKDSYYLYQSQWNDNLHTLHILPAWNDGIYKNAKGEAHVVVYTDAPEVELFFTDAATGEKKSLGKKSFKKYTTEAGHSYQLYEGDGAATGNNKHKNLYLSWDVPYKAGTVTAEAHNADGSVIDTSDTALWRGRQSVKTTGAAARLVASVDRASITADGDDLAYVHVSVTDKDGNIVANAGDTVTFKVEGAGELAGVDNGSSPDHTSYRSASRNAWAGELVGIVRSNTAAGSITVTATAPGLESATITINTTAAADADEARIVESLVYSRHYYVMTGTSPNLPQKIQVNYSDGTSEEAEVSWDEIPADKLAQPGSFEISGSVAGVKANVVVTVLDSIATVLNYSDTTPTGTVPTMPDSRPAAMADGTIINAAFPVTWNMPADERFDKAGVVSIDGTAELFGKTMPITATIRVQDETISLTNNVARAGTGTIDKVEQNIPEDKQSDTLAAINDGSTELAANIDGGPNESCWSNFSYSQSDAQDANKAELTFVYNTQMRFGKAVIHFAQDSNSMAYPDPETIKFQVSDDLNGGWRDLEVTESIGEEKNNVKPYTYTFEPTTATYVKVLITNAKQKEGARKKPCTAITEVELIAAEGSYTSEETAELDALTVNDKDVPSSALRAFEYATAAIVADAEATPADNAAVTLLPVYDNQRKIIIESEDHKTRNTFVIRLGVDEPLDPSDDTLDIPSDDMKVSAGSEVEDNHVSATEGKIALAFDKKSETYWHTAWKATPATDHWVQIDLDEPACVDALRYLPRQTPSNANGTVTSYEVQYFDEEAKEWKTVSAGDWSDPNNKDWRLAEFDKTVCAKQFRFVGVHTYADSGNDKYMSAAEIALRKEQKKVDISKAVLSVPKKFEVDSVSKDLPATFDPTLASVTLDGKILRYGVDYILEYANNTQEGQATVRALGIVDYAGETEAQSFEIVTTGTPDEPDEPGTNIPGTDTPGTDPGQDGQDPVQPEHDQGGQSTDNETPDQTGKDFKGKKARSQKLAATGVPFLPIAAAAYAGAALVLAGAYAAKKQQR